MDHSFAREDDGPVHGSRPVLAYVARLLLGLSIFPMPTEKAKAEANSMDSHAYHVYRAGLLLVYCH